MSKVYAVIFDGWKYGHGSEIFCAGVYTSIDRAKRKTREITAFEDLECKIIEFEVDKDIPIECNTSGFLECECYLGGYIE